MHILHLEASPGWGGQEIRVLREAEGMRSRGHEVILGIMKGGALIGRARSAGFIVYELNFQKAGWIFCLLQLLLIFWRHRIELVNTHSSLDSWIGGIAARIGRKKIVRTRHLSTPIKGGWNGRVLYGKLADFVVTTCSAVIPMVMSQSGKRLDQCRSIATGVDPERIRFSEEDRQQFRKKVGAGPQDLLVGTACFMRSWKGIDDFLKAADLLREMQEIKWVIIGGGHEETYRKRAEQMGLKQIIHFTGHLDQPFPALAALDLFLLLSTANEGVSQAILQAAYLEKPLIATPTGGLGEVCLDRVTGLQVPLFSPDRVAAAVLEMNKNRLLREEFGKKGKKLVEERFTFAKTVDQMEEVFKSLLSPAIG